MIQESTAVGNRKPIPVGDQRSLFSNEMGIFTAAQSDYYLLSPQAFFSDLQREIKRASSQIDMQFFTFQGDHIGGPIGKLLIAMQRRGVAGRLMIDNYINLSHDDRYIFMPRWNRELKHRVRASWLATNELLTHLHNSGINVKLTNPVGFLGHKLLRRSHRKLVVIDGYDPANSVAYVGGINPTEHNASWNDFMIKMTGGVASSLQRVFDYSWDNQPLGGTIPFSDGYILCDAYRQPIIMRAATDLIRSATNRVILESAYLWGRHICQELAHAARNVLVQLIVPLNNHKQLFTPSRRMLETLARNGVQVYQYRSNTGMTHARALLVDDIGLFGSCAFNGLLSGTVEELSILTTNASLVLQLGSFLAKDINESVRMI